MNIDLSGLTGWWSDLVHNIQDAWGTAVTKIEATSGSYTVTLANGEILSVNGQTGEITIIQQGTGPDPGPFSPGTITPNVPFVPPDQVKPSQGGGGGNVSTGGTQPFDITALKWLGALVLLWIILAAMNEYSPNTAMFAKAFAGLILLGALYYLGPGAMSNIPNLWKKPGTAGPNPVPGA